MTIKYSFEIMRVDAQAKCMDILYTANNKPDMLIGVRLPWSDESVLSIVEMYSPIANWVEQERTVLVPEVGLRGVVEPVVQPVQNQQNLAMWQQIELEQKIAKALVKFGVLQEDPTAVAVTSL